MSPSRSARSQAFEGRGLFYSEEIEASLDFSFIGSRLMAQSQSSDDFVILLDVRLLQVIEQTSTMLDHLQQAAPRMIVLFVRLEMLGEFVDPLT
jgi:RNase adaptor protein for sRNA GlmZ degradation